jgi:hypothetical protein
MWTRSSRLRHYVVFYVVTNILEKPITSIFMAEISQVRMLLSYIRSMAHSNTETGKVTRRATSKECPKKANYQGMPLKGANFKEGPYKDHGRGGQVEVQVLNLVS